MTDTARTQAETMAAASPLAAAALAFGDLVETVDARRDTIPVHRLDTTATVREATDRGHLADGDVFVVEPEGVTGFIAVHVPAAITEQRGDLPHLTHPARDYADGRYADSIHVATRQARALGLPLRDEALTAFEAGDRILCPDGRTRSVADTIHAGGRVWVADENGAAWPADRCQRIDDSNVDPARRCARKAALLLRGNAGGPAQSEAVRDLGDALRYLAQAAPAALDELIEGAAARITVDIPRLDVVPTDVLHHHGARLLVLDTGISTGADPQWWAKLHGVTDADRRATYRAPWTTGLRADSAFWDVVTVERVLPGLPG